MALRKPRFKTQRRLGTELPGLGKAGALERQPLSSRRKRQQKKKILRLRPSPGRKTETPLQLCSKRAAITALYKRFQKRGRLLPTG